MNPKKISIVLAVCALFAFILKFYLRSEARGLDYKTLPNGIWADVQPFIDKNSYTPFHKKALTEFYLEFENELLHPEICLKTKESMAPDNDTRTSECLDDVFKKYGHEIPMDELEDAIVNNQARALAYAKYNGYCSGGMFGGWVEDMMGPACDFPLK